MIEAVIFDCGGVLIDDPIDNLKAYCAAHLGVDQEALWAEFQKYAPDFQVDAISEDDLWRRVCDELGVATPRVASLWRTAFENVYSPKPEMFLLASGLREKGYKVGLLSNTEIPIMEFLVEQQYPMFHEQIFSCQERIAKPASEIYLITARKLGVFPEQSVLIDDDPDNQAGARRIGMVVLPYEHSIQVTTELSVLLRNLD